jgi:hypothetical protein
MQGTMPAGDRSMLLLIDDVGMEALLREEEAEKGKT